ncbi:MAG: CIA30 family protein [Cephaloticoccus sp.]|nr:CIA30 family protein [Cephaloticoccus sp.]MCF7761687.1 CIA30 family protein [Cephaloticoccus sp.]
MNTPTSSLRCHSAALRLAGSFLFALFLFGPLTLGAAAAPAAPALLDDFSDAELMPTGAGRFVVNDKDVGGQSRATMTCANGVLAVEGQLVPGRGMPAFVSLPLLLALDAQPRDLSAYTGVRLRVKVRQGLLSVQVASTEVQNFDFHTGGPVMRQPGDFQEVRLPFAAMKRAWSEQIPLNPNSITSVNLVAVGMAPGAFAYEVDEIGFY